MSDKCEIPGCEVEALYTVKIKKSDTDDKVYKVCQLDRDSLDTQCNINGWEFLEI